MLIAMSMLRSGYGFVLSHMPFQHTCMVTDDIITASAYLSIEDVPDYSVHEALNEVLWAKCFKSNTQRVWIYIREGNIALILGQKMSNCLPILFDPKNGILKVLTFT